MHDAVQDSVSAGLQSWAERELRHWRAQGLRRVPAERHLHDLADRVPNLRLYQFAEGTVTLQPRKGGSWANEFMADRAALYLQLFQLAAQRLPANLNTVICVCLGDIAGTYPVPVFGFQRKSQDVTPLLPDIDFLINDFYESAEFHDPVAYADKVARAVFAGATTGEIIDADKARTYGTRRLHSARFFLDKAEVDFRLPHIVHCLTDEARSILETQIFCQAPRLSWAEQFTSRFLISMDGNGATCSRVAISLASNSVLLKYQSEHMLYYFPAMLPNVHYVPIAEDADVLDVVAIEQGDPGHHAAISQEARAFAATYLTRARVLEYTTELVAAYAGIFDEPEPVPEPSARRVISVARTIDGTDHLAEGPGWAGSPGTGAKLGAIKVLSQPRSTTARLLCQVLTEDGRFSPTRAEGTWCGGGDAGQAIIGLRLLTTSNASTMTPAVEASFADGCVIRAASGVACRSPGGAPMEAFRVHLS